MFSKSLLLITAVTMTGAFAQADKKLIDEKIGSALTDQTIHYELLSNEASPAADIINKNIRQSLLDNSCLEDEDGPNQMYYDGTAQIRTANSNYVSYEIATDSYCGGAHPNAGVYYILSDARTGAMIEMNKEVPQQTVDSNTDFDALDRFQNALAKKMVAQLKASGSSELDANSCLEGLSMSEKIEAVADMYPTLAGLSDGKIIATISPAHVMTGCTFEVEMSLKQVSEFVKPDSILRSWLRPSAE